MQAKQNIRETLLSARRHIQPSVVVNLSRKIFENFCHLYSKLGGETVALYSPCHNEVDTAEIFSFLRSKPKRVLFPVVSQRASKSELLFAEVSDLSELTKGYAGILEPSVDRLLYALSDIDVCIVPGVAFDRNGHRLGYGRGFYDRLLNQRGPSWTIGLCYEQQLVDQLPTENFDVPVDYVVTENGAIPCFLKLMREGSL